MEKPVRSRTKKKDQSLLEILLSESDSFEIETLPPWQQQFLTAYMFKEARSVVSITVVGYAARKKSGVGGNRKHGRTIAPLFEPRPESQPNL
jgi:hypothetical protein